MIETSMIWGAVFGILCYFIPTIIAVSTKRTKRDMIMLVNFLVGWTGIGWLGCLFWAAMAESDPLRSQFKCDECGRTITVEKEHKILFCQTCGQKYEITVR